MTHGSQKRHFRGTALALVGPNLALRGPPGVVIPYPNHDKHLHVRIRNPDV